MKTVGMGQDLWAAMYLSLLEYGVCLCQRGEPIQHIRVLLETLIPPVAAAAGRPALLVAMEEDLKLTVVARERAIAALTN